MRLLVQFQDGLGVSEVISVTMRNQDEIHVQSSITVSLRELGVILGKDRYQRIRRERIDQNARILRLNEEARVSQPYDLRHIFVQFRIVENEVTLPRFPFPYIPLISQNEYSDAEDRRPSKTFHTEEGGHDVG